MQMRLGIPDPRAIAASMGRCSLGVGLQQMSELEGIEAASSDHIIVLVFMHFSFFAYCSGPANS